MTKAVCSALPEQHGSIIGIKLLNPLSWQRKGLVKLAVTRLPRGEFELIDSTTREEVVYERRGGSIRFVAPPVPAGGYLLLNVKPVTQRTQPGLPAEWEERNLTLHTSDFNDTLPLVVDWASLGGQSGRYDQPVDETNKPLYRYQGSRDVFRCPADRGDIAGIQWVGFGCTNLI